MKKILPVTYPPITAFPAIAQPLSILFCNKEKIMPWFIPRYIQLYAFKANTGGKLHEISANFFDAASDPRYNLKNYVLPRDLIDAKWSSFTEFIIDCINKDYYLNLSMNMFYFPCSPAYHEYNFMHFPMIYGYDDETKLFNVSDFYKDSVYSFEEVPYDEMEKSYTSTSFEDQKAGEWYDSWSHVCFWKYRTDVNFDFDLNELITVLNDYISGKDSTQYFIHSHKYEEQDCYYGIRFYDAVSYCLKEGRYDIRPLHLLCDQKKAFLIKLEYLLSNKYITEEQYETLNEKCKHLYDMSAANRNLLLKSRLTEGNSTHIERIIKNLDDIKVSDLEFCNELIQSLQSNKF